MSKLTLKDECEAYQKAKALDPSEYSFTPKAYTEPHSELFNKRSSREVYGPDCLGPGYIEGFHCATPKRY